MLKFSLAEYNKDSQREIVTRSGLPVRIICINRKGFNTKPIVALVKEKNGTELIHGYWDNGDHAQGREEDLDLFFNVVKRQGFVILTYGLKNELVPTGVIYNTKEDALAAAENLRCQCLIKDMFAAIGTIEYEY